MKKGVYALLFSALLLSSAGCSSNKDVSSSSNNSKAGDSGKVELTYVSTQGEEAMKAVIDGFEQENPNIKVKVEHYPFRSLFETIEVKMGSKSKDVDLIDVDVPLVTNYSVKGYLEPLDKYLSPGIKEKWIDSAVTAGSYKGELMAPPLNSSSQVLFYNKKILQERGVTPPPMEPEKRWTWEQVVEAAKKLTYDKNGDKQTDVFGFSFEQISRPYQILPLSQGLGAEAVDKDGLVSEGYTNSKEAIKAGKFYYDLFNTWKVSPKIPVEQAPEYFKSGKIAFFVGGTWNIKAFTDAGIDFGVAPHPYFEGGKIVTPTGSWHIGVSKYSTKKEAAAKFVEFLTAGKGAQIWQDQTKGLPANVDLLKQIETDPKYEKFPENVNRLGAYEASHTAVPRPLTPGYLEWETLVNKAYEDIKNGTDPKQALDTAAAQIDRQLKKYTSAVK
ncbi:ABC transporter substrate-binding protein [Neobacillus cucumis]|uniref:ABC transporter substrate-binding protein n=1 Tax=Neobacillus cucumis TaxID=1740721 RepID=A0A2N5HVX3_9BACI|nr:sugar ABC transporter substrate-binding protein [Neobacillus cucumis]PLS09668.1 ABC transporter substrate-binding protein [Neobacillus cucumis]